MRRAVGFVKRVPYVQFGVAGRRTLPDSCLQIDGSYGAAMALARDIPEEFTALLRLDTISWDPHKWLRVPYEAGCLLAREEGVLSKTFSHRPSYYTFNDYSDVDHYYEKGFQNSRHLRAFKVWMSLKQHGTEGHSKFIARDLTLTGLFHEAVKKQKNLQALFCNMCVSTFRFVPDELADGSEDNVAILDKFNAEIVDETHKGGNFYITNAIVQEAFYLRVCFVNSQTQESDIPIILDDIVRQGHKCMIESEIMPRPVEEARSLPLFCFGTLRDPDLFFAVTQDESMERVPRQSGSLQDYASLCVLDGLYPVIKKQPGAKTTGTVYYNLPKIIYDKLIWFEWPEFVLSTIQVNIGRDSRLCAYFRPVDTPTASNEQWTLETWTDANKAEWIKYAQLAMAMYGVCTLDEREIYWDRIVEFVNGADVDLPSEIRRACKDFKVKRV